MNNPEWHQTKDDDGGVSGHEKKVKKDGPAFQVALYSFGTQVMPGVYKTLTHFSYLEWIRQMLRKEVQQFGKFFFLS
jgi:hypothetical protein